MPPSALCGLSSLEPDLLQNAEGEGLHYLYGNEKV
jgi:hypothetical protein